MFRVAGTSGVTLHVQSATTSYRCTDKKRTRCSGYSLNSNGLPPLAAHTLAAVLPEVQWKFLAPESQPRHVETSPLNSPQRSRSRCKPLFSESVAAVQCFCQSATALHSSRISAESLRSPVADLMDLSTVDGVDLHLPRRLLLGSSEKRNADDDGPERTITGECKFP